MKNKDKKEEQSSAIVQEISLSAQGKEALASLLLSESGEPKSPTKP